MAKIKKTSYKLWQKCVERETLSLVGRSRKLYSQSGNQFLLEKLNIELLYDLATSLLGCIQRSLSLSYSRGMCASMSLGAQTWKQASISWWTDKENRPDAYRWGSISVGMNRETWWETMRRELEEFRKLGNGGHRWKEGGKEVTEKEIREERERKSKSNLCAKYDSES